jgi:hypothetical protein
LFIVLEELLARRQAPLAFMLVSLQYWISERIQGGAALKVRSLCSRKVYKSIVLIRKLEAWGEDMVLTSHMGVAYASGLSKNSTWSDPDAVVPVMKVCTYIFLR